MPRLPPRSVLITGATGYLGRPLAALAACRGHAVRAFVRHESAARLPGGIAVVAGDPFNVDRLVAAHGSRPGDVNRAAAPWGRDRR